MQKKMISDMSRILAASVALAAGSVWADDVPWPSDFEQRVAERIAAAEPSGDAVAASPALSTFDSRSESTWSAILDLLCSRPLKGLMLLFR